jgi:hypothetical protein
LTGVSTAGALFASLQFIDGSAPPEHSNITLFVEPSNLQFDVKSNVNNQSRFVNWLSMAIDLASDNATSNQ